MFHTLCDTVEYNYMIQVQIEAQNEAWCSQHVSVVLCHYSAWLQSKVSKCNYRWKK